MQVNNTMSNIVIRSEHHAWMSSDLENQILMTDEQFNQSDITDAQIYFKNTINFPRLVAKHYNTFEIVKKQNGGSENQSYIFLENLFTNPNNFLYLIAK